MISNLQGRGTSIFFTRARFLSSRAFIIAILLGIVVGAAHLSDAQATAPAPPPAPCSAAENRQFDFWVGHWDVYPKKAPLKKVAQSNIEKLYSGCAIRENWMPLVAGGDGGSLNSYRPEDGQWHQIWADSGGGWVEFIGKWNGASMVLEGAWPQPGHPKQRTRMTYTRQADGSVEQLGESSDDEGQSWQPSFDFIYRPAPERTAAK
jgi:hypothetical protein